MRNKIIILSLLSCMCCMLANAQVQPATNASAVDAESLRLYNEGKWKELMDYGIQQLQAGAEFPLLHMRVGFAAFKMKNYSVSLKQYEIVYEADQNNAVAIYYLYLDNLFLDNIAGARYYAALLSTDVKTSEKIKSFSMSGLHLEYSYKQPSIIARGDATYERFGADIQLGYRLTLEQSVAFFNQHIDEPKLTSVTNNQDISIAQKEYYAKFLFSLNGRTSLVGGMHYLYTPFNNFIYNNYIGFAGVRFNTPYVQFQALIQAGQIRDSSFTQFDASLKTYPLGNSKLYTITRAGIGSDFAFTQVVGVEALKNIWLEANATLGKYRKMLGNDALYVYDDIDTKKMKIGGGIYFLLGRTALLKINYTFEQKIRYGSLQNTFNQNAITGGISCNF